MKLHINLDHITFYAYHGVLEQERRVGNTFEVSVSAEVDCPLSLVSDALEDTISYADMYALIAEQMAIPAQLLEHVCGRIALRLFEAFAPIEALRVSVSKRKPPIAGDIPSATVVLELHRSELSRLR